MQQDLPVDFTAVVLLSPYTETLVDQPCRHRCAAINAKKSLKLYFDQSDLRPVQILVSSSDEEFRMLVLVDPHPGKNEEFRRGNS